MDSKFHWENFVTTGSISDYLKYRQSVNEEVNEKSAYNGKWNSDKTPKDKRK